MIRSKFGKAPSGKRLEAMRKSPNFRDGKFHTLSFTPQLTEGHSMFGIIYSMLFKRNPARIPSGKIPSVKSDIRNLRPDEDVLIWFGHSSYFIQLDGKKILVDPVFSRNASPIAGSMKAFEGSDIYSVDDLPEIDYLFISHDHYDHLDYLTMQQLKGKVKKIICGLGVGSHLEYWGYDASAIIEKDWQDTVKLDENFSAVVLPARHFSGRGISRNNTLWCSFLLQTPTMKIYLGGDSGYDSHFEEIGNTFGPVDLAILENGQYNQAWKYIHMVPAEVLKAAKDLKAERLLPVHSSKFPLSSHNWNEPLLTIAKLNKEAQVPLVTPVIGEIVRLKDKSQAFREWWKDVK